MEDTNKITFRNVFGIGAGNEKCRPRKDTNKIKFRNEFGIGAGNEICQKIIYDINILDQKNDIFAEDNFLILELQRCTGFMQPKEDTNKIEFRNAFGMGPEMKNVKKYFMT